jgi:hypothetical protein
VSGGATVVAWVMLGLLYLAFYLVVRHKEVRAAWSRRGEGDGWSWKLLIPRPDRPWMAWATFGVYGLLALFWYSHGTLWLAVPSTALCLISIAQGIWGESPKDA